MRLHTVARSFYFALALLLTGVTGMATEIPFGDPKYLPLEGNVGDLGIVADLDGDGDLDTFVSPFSDGPGLTWLENDGGPSDRWVRRTIGPPIGYNHAGAADIDRDGDVDIFALSGNIFTGTLRWFDNDGASPPSFTERTIFTSATFLARFGHATDLDRDGDVDLLVALGNNDGDLVWFENNGAAIPGWTQRTVSNGTGFNAATSADVDGDGDLDVIGVDDEFNTEVIWYENDGATPPGTWTARTIGTTPSRSLYTTAGDIDSDGDVDVVIPYGSGLITYISDGAAVPTWTATTIPGSFGTHRIPRLTDLDLDGDRDIVIPVGDSGQMRWYENDGGSPASWTLRVIATDIDNAYWGDFGDVDNDGDIDVLASGAGNAWIENRTIHRNAAFASALAITSTSSAFATDPLALGDVDNDGDIDVAIGITDGINRLYLNNGTSDPWNGVTGLDITTDVQPTRRVALGDFDGDGDLDFVSGNQRGSGPVSRLYLNNGTADPFNGAAFRDLDTGIQSFAMQAGDLDGDGDLDLATSNPLRVLLNNGTADPFNGVSAIVYTTVGVDRMKFADLDDDGDLDWIGVGGAGAHTRLNNGTADPFNGVPEVRLGTDTSSRREAAIGDVDNDGDLDIIVGGTAPIPIFLYLNNGTSDPFNGVVEIPIVTSGTQTSFISLGDLDADGDLDLVRTGFRVIPQVFYNNGTADPFLDVAGVNLPSHFSAATADARDLAIADLDSNGKLDVVISKTGLDSSPGLVFLPNTGGQFREVFSNCISGVAAVEGSEIPLHRIDMEFYGRPGDSPGRMLTTTLDFTDEPADLSTIVDTINVYRDNGDAQFDAASDLLLQSYDVATFPGGVGGIYQLTYPDAPNSIVAAPTSYFFTVNIDADATNGTVPVLNRRIVNGSSQMEDANAGVLLDQAVFLGSACGSTLTLFENLVVDDTADGADANPGNGVCATVGGSCTLRAAIMEANATPVRGFITIPAGNYNLTIPGDETAGAQGDLNLTNPYFITLAGAGPGLTTIDASAVSDRVFGISNGGTVTLKGLTVTGGDVGASGGGILSSDTDLVLDRVEVLGNSAGNDGGGIFLGAGSSLQVERSLIAGNTTGAGRGGGVYTGSAFSTFSETAIRGNSSGGFEGGGVSGFGVLLFSQCEVSGNTGDGAIRAEGASSVADLRNTTVSGNIGNGVAVTGNGSLSLADSTVVSNSAVGVFSCPGCPSTNLYNTIVANNGTDCSGSIFSNGYNLIENAGCTLFASGSGNQTGVDPQLAALGNYGGTTLTHRPLIGSPTIDAGNCLAVTVDQTGQTRPVNDPNTANVSDGCDIGAYEARLGQSQPTIEIPVRWCGLRGAPSVEDPGVVGQLTVNDVLRRRHEVLSESIYTPQSGIGFRSGGNFIIEDYPVLDDPDCTEDSPGVFTCATGQHGDVSLNLDEGNFSEFQDLIASCREQWEALDPDIQGVTAVHINQFVDQNGAQLDILGVGGRAPLGDAAEQFVAGRVMVVDNFYRQDFPGSPNPPNPLDLNDRLLGHELGHALSLLHGNGIDDDNDGFLDNNDEASVGEPRFDGPNLLQYRNGDEITELQTLQMRSHILLTIPDAGAIPFSDSVADGTPIDEENARILQFGYDALTDVENARILQFENARLLQFENARILQFENARILQFENARLLQFENARILQFGMGFSGAAPTDDTTFHVSLSALPWPAAIRPDTRYYFYLDLDSDDATGGYPSEYANPLEPGFVFPGSNNLTAEPPIGAEVGVDMILQVTLASECPGEVCESTAELNAFEFNDATSEYELVFTDPDPDLSAYNLGLYQELNGAPIDLDDAPTGFTIRPVIPNQVLFDAGWSFQSGPNGPIPTRVGMEVMSEIECDGRVLNDDTSSDLVDCQCTDCADCPDYPGCSAGVGTPRQLNGPRLVTDFEVGLLTFEPPVLPRATAAPALAQEGDTITLYVLDLPTDVIGTVEVTLGDLLLATTPTSNIDTQGRVSLSVPLPSGFVGELILSSGITGFAPRATTVVTVTPNPVDPDNDGDGIPDATDPDDDNDGVADTVEINAGTDPLNAFECGDGDADTCDDCYSGSQAASNDGRDFDLDGLCDAGDPDDDNDGIPDTADGEPLNPNACGDTDNDRCDDCVVTGSSTPLNDGDDLDGDGLCDFGDPDADNDGVGVSGDPDDRDAYVCGDSDADTCDDCSVAGTSSPANDGPDADADGLCDAGDPNEAPVAVCSNVSVNADAQCQASASVDNGSYDPDGAGVTVTESPAGPFPLGDTSVTLTAEDLVGDTAQCTAVVTVVDATQPAIATCAADRTLFSDVTDGKAELADLTGEISASDACGAVTASQSPMAGTRLSSGTHDVTITVIDDVGNSSECIAQVTVLDRILSESERARVHFHHGPDGSYRNCNDVDDDDDEDDEDDEENGSPPEETATGCFSRLALTGDLRLRNAATFPADLVNPANDTVDATLVVSLSGQVISEEQIQLDVRDHHDEKWEFRGSGGPMQEGVRRLKIDWKETASYDSHQGTSLPNSTPRIFTRFIGFDETDLRIRYKNVPRPFQVTFTDPVYGAFSIDVLNAQGHSTTSVAGDFDLRSRRNGLQITLPFRLTPDTSISFSTDGGTTQESIPVNTELNYQPAGARYRFHLNRTAISNLLCEDPTNPVNSLSSPQLEVVLRLGSGSEEVVGLVGFGPDPADWNRLNDRHWIRRP